MGQVQQGLSQLQDTLVSTIECDDCKDSYNHSSCSTAAWSGGDEAACDAAAHGSVGGPAAESVTGAFAEEVSACAADALVLLPPGLRLVVLGGALGRVPDEACAKLIRKLARRLGVALPGQLAVLMSGKPGVQTALATGLGDSPSLVHLLPDSASVVGTPGRRVSCGRTARVRDAALVQLGQAFLVFEGDADAASIALAIARSGSLVLPVHRTASYVTELRPEWVTKPEWACLAEKSSPNVVAAGVMAILVKAARREHVEVDLRRSTKSWLDARSSSPILTCLDAEHVRFQASLLDPEDTAHLQSHDFLDACHSIFHAADADSSGFLEAGHEAGQIGEAVREVLPSVFRDRFAGMHAQNYALSFDHDWDGKLSFDEFVSFCQWAAMMQARGLFTAQARLHGVSAGQGERLLIVSDYMDAECTLHAAVKSGVDVACYSPSGITALEFAQRIAAARRLRENAGLRPYKSVAVANHGPDPEGTWEPFAGVARKLTSAADVEHLVPVFVELASLLPREGGGRLDLLACNLAGAPGGMFFVKRLEEETGQCVCASKDATGNVEQGGNWIMEVGDVNVAPDYFDEARLRDFDRLMRLKIKRGAGSRLFSRLSTHRRTAPGGKPKKATRHEELQLHHVKVDPTRKVACRVRDHLDSSSSSSSGSEE